MSKKLEDLNKINFWQAVEVLYPKATAYFKLWVDGYKADNDWDDLFNDHDMDKNRDIDFGNATYSCQSPKFHDIPFAMQMGIFTQFLAEQGSEVETMVKDMKDITLDAFKEMERAL